MPEATSGCSTGLAAAKYYCMKNAAAAVEEEEDTPVELEKKAIRRFAKVSIVSHSCPSLMMIASASHFHVYLPWGQCPFSIVS